jgi:hypothetical protein
LHVGAEEDRCTEDALEGGYQPSVLCPTLLHTERVKHLRCASELNRLPLLTDRQRSQKNRNEPVLTPREAVRRMASHLKRKLAIASFVEQLARRGLLIGSPHSTNGREAKPRF